MIKQIVHIDRNYPRKLNGVDAKSLGENQAWNNPDWSFDTRAKTDDINGEIADNGESQYKITKHTIDDGCPEQLFDDRTATEEQYANLTTDKQIRFNANVFNYIVHTSIEDIVLKYDSPVVYAEGKENEYTGEFVWKEKYIVIDGMPYHIMFDILMHDPIGIDMKCYEAYVRGALFGRFDRKNDVITETQADERVDYAEFRSETSVSTHYGKWSTAPSLSKYITIHSATEHFAFSKLPDPYSATETSYKISVQLSGTGYDDKYVNTDPADYENWLSVISNSDSTEEQITEAWKACDGVKFKFFDVAGNVTYWVMPYIEIVVTTLDELYNLKKLLLEFINTRPADLQLGTDLIGRTTIKVTNPNRRFSDCDILIDLDKESLGELCKNTRKETFIVSNGQRIAKIATEDVGNIDDSGWVIAHAVLDIADFIDELEFARIMVRNITRADGSLGEWIKECSDNIRKITLDPFVPQYLKETTDKKSAYYRFVKFTEKYLNTMFKAYDKNCYISVLEAIARIGNFNDYNTIYGNLLDKYDNDHGDMLHITSDELALLLDVDKQVKNHEIQFNERPLD